jgi:membrane associated rhomboid family serine protease
MHYSGRARRTARAGSGNAVFVLPIRRGSRTPPVPIATLALALASALVFLLFAPHDRAALNAAATFYVDSGLAEVELPRYLEYLTQSTDSEATDRLSRLQRAATRTVGRLADPAAVVEVLLADRRFERDLHADKVVTPADTGYAEWKNSRQHFDQLVHATLSDRIALSTESWHQPWRLVTYLLLHPTAPLWLSNLLVLLLVGPFAEAAAGAGLFVLCYLGGGAFCAVVNLLLTSRPAVGDWGALAALAAMLAATFGTHSMTGRLAAGRHKIPTPGVAALAVVIGVEALRWILVGRVATDLPADLSGMAFGAAFATALKLRDSRRAHELVWPGPSSEAGAPKESALAIQAREAATRLETRRATELFKELVDLEPRRVEHLCGYLNVALMGPDETVLQDAALRLLWLRAKTHSDQLRKTFLLLTQPKVLKVLPIDEHLRLSRRLVKLHEDAAALKVLDAILSDSHLRQLYGRQLADCLLGIYTGYMRRRLTTLAETIRSRLTQYFEAPDHLGGLPPATRPPTTVYTGSLRTTLSSFRGPNSRFRS